MDGGVLIPPRLAAAAVPAVVLLVGAAASCALGGFDFDKAPPGGAESATGAQGGTGGQSATAGVGGDAGASVHCQTVADCPGADTECAHRSCDAGACVVVAAPMGELTPDQTPQDCFQRVCDGRGGITSLPDPRDTFDDVNDCTDDTCESTGPSNPPKPSGTLCGTTGQLTCDGAGTCKGCTQASQCGGLVPCVTWDCTAGACTKTTLDEGKSCGLPCKTCQSGACANAPADTEDLGACPPSMPCETGTCNGNGQCKLSPAGTVCGQPSCSTDVLHEADVCDAAGTCVVGATTDCSPYTCVGAPASCTTTCATDVDCADSHECAPSGDTCADCSSCAEFLAMPGANLPICAASTLKFDELKVCVCGTLCKAACGLNLCMKMNPNSMCTACINASCSSQIADCNTDVGAH